MNVLLLSIADVEGGAARAAYRLHQGLQRNSIKSQMLVQEKFSDDPTVFNENSKLAKGFAKLKPTLDNLPLKFYRQREDTVFSCEWLSDSISSKVARLKPDVINIHWICNGYLQIETLAKFQHPAVLTLHDMWAFTGGCHYSQDCTRYRQSCGNCPQLHSSQTWDVSRWIWQRKASAWKNWHPTIVTPSRWLANCARSSSLFQDEKIEVIPNGIDLQQYKPIDRKLAREILNLPQDKRLILFGAVKATSDRRKGFHLLQASLQMLEQTDWQNTAELLVLGASHSPNETLKFTTRYLGKLKDDISLSLVYSAVDVFVAPSIQDNLPNTVLEAIACGTPCVAFDIGGMPDLIEHQKNGYLAPAFEVDALARGIAWVLEDDDRYQTLSQFARKKAEQEFSLELQAKRYIQMFEELMTRHQTREERS
jgi:glycosyltransferase involved in cell wall biosynthesis